MIKKIINMVLQLLNTEQPYVVILNVIFLIALVCLFLFISKYGHDHKIIKKFIAKVKADTIEQERLREEEYKKQFEMEGYFKTKSRMLRLNKKLTDSGLKDTFPELLPETFLLFCALLVTVVILLFAFLDFPFLSVVAVGAFTVLIIVFTVELMISANTSRIEKETVKFVNLLKNNSHVGGSIGDILGRTIPFISGPLRVNVEKCYYEIKVTGDTSTALLNLANRTNYKKLKEVFNALRVCATHNEDYEGVIDETNVSINQYISFRKETRQIKQSNLIEMAFMGVMGVVIIYIMKGMLPDIDVWYYIFKTTPGILIISCMAAILLFGIYKAIKNEE